MIRTKASALCLVVLVLVSGSTTAGVPDEISYQGRLTDADGVAVPDGDYNITFQIHEHDPVPMGEPPLWSSGVQTVSVTDGLFTYYLGSNVPLPVSIFTNDGLESHYLRFILEGSPMASRGVLLASVPFAVRSVLSDTALYAHSGPGSGAAGWVDDGSVVRLQSGSDRVGLGTSVASEPLVVGNDLGSFPEANYVVSSNANFEGFSGYKLGWNADNHATIAWYGDGDQLRFSTRSMGNSYNNTMAMRSGMVGINNDYPQEPLVVGAGLGASFGDLITISRTGTNRYSGIMFGEDAQNKANIIWYNNTNEMRLQTESDGVAYSSTLVLKDGEVITGGTGNASVQLGNNAISAPEILDEPGLNEFEKTDWVTVKRGANAICGVSTTFPASGYALVLGSAQIVVGDRPYNVETIVSISDIVDQHGELGCLNYYHEGTTLEKVTQTIHSVVEVEAAGPKTIWLMGSFNSMGGVTDSSIAKGYIDILYVPTWYGAGKTVSTDAVTGSDQVLSSSEYSHIEQIITERVRQETARVEAEFNARLQSLMDEIVALRREP